MPECRSCRSGSASTSTSTSTPPVPSERSPE
jgi:hypothetical protein